MNKDKYIEMISLFSDQYGNELINMMEQYGKQCLRDISCEETKEYYEKLKEKKGI